MFLFIVYVIKNRLIIFILILIHKYRRLLGVGLDSSDDEDTTKDAANTKNILNADSSDDSGPDDMPSTKEAEEKGSQTSK